MAGPDGRRCRSSPATPARCCGWSTLSLAAGIAASAVYLAYDPPWLKSLGELATTGIGLAAAIRLWQVFPFTLSSGWSIAVRVLLVVAIAGSCIALVVQIVSLARCAGICIRSSGSAGRPGRPPDSGALPPVCDTAVIGK